MFLHNLFLYLICPFSCILSTVIVQDYYWRDYMPGIIPLDAFLVGKNRFIIQVNNPSGTIPGTLYPDTDIAVIDFNGKLIYKDKSIKVLCAPDHSRLYWDRVDFTKTYDTQMKNAVKGGYTGNIDLYIGTVIDDGEVKIGRVIPIDVTTNGLYIWDANAKVKRLQIFDLLKYNTTILSSDGSVIFSD